MKTLKSNQAGFSHVLVPILVVALITIMGVKVLTNIHADAPTDITLDASSAVSATKNVAILGPAYANAGADSAQSTVPYNFIGYQTVDYLAPGDSLTYNQGVKGNETSCYFVYVDQPKVGNASETIEFANNNNYVIKNMTSNSSDNLQEVCVPPGQLANPGFEVKNLTSAQQVNNIEVYQDVLSW